MGRRLAIRRQRTTDTLATAPARGRRPVAEPDPAITVCPAAKPADRLRGAPRQGQRQHQRQGLQGLVADAGARRGTHAGKVALDARRDHAALPPGRHAIDVRINGQAVAQAAFSLALETLPRLGIDSRGHQRRSPMREQWLSSAVPASDRRQRSCAVAGATRARCARRQRGCESTHGSRPPRNSGRCADRRSTPAPRRAPGLRRTSGSRRPAR